MGIHLKEKDVERFNSKIIKASDENQCWLWNGTLSTSGYGQFQVRDKCVYAHRAMYAIKFGEIPENGHVCHKCDNPLCVNPSHLFLGDAVINMKDRFKKGRYASIRGENNKQSKLSESQVLEIKKYLAQGIRQQDIAKIYSVSQICISLIKRGINWRHIKYG